MITVSAKGTDQKTGLPLSYERGKVEWNEKAAVFIIEIRPFITYPNNTVQYLPSFPQIIQDNPAVNYSVGEVITPAVVDVDGVTILTAAVISDGTQIKTPANPAYSALCIAFNTVEIGAEIDTYINNLTV